VPGKNFPALIDGYDIISFRVEEDPYRPVGSLVDFLYDYLPVEDFDNPNLSEILQLLGNLTERHGNLAGETDQLYLGYLTAVEVTLLRSLLERSKCDSLQTMSERDAMVKILGIAEKRRTGLIFSQM
jgi:hypothetical protein